MNVGRITRGLGWFSLALGATELLLPGRLSRLLGVQNHGRLVRSFGAREIAAGLGLLGAARKSPWMWARFAGDALDLGALAAARRRSVRPGATSAALAGVAAITALDWLTARRSR